MRPKLKPHSGRFWRQCYGARRRGIDFLFSYKEWVNWWEEQLGPDWFKYIGKTKNTFCMARNGDIGPYAPWNVHCATKAQNRAEQRTKLTKNQVIKIFKSNKTQHELAAEFKISRSYVSLIKIGARWGEVTKNLTPPV